MKCLIILVFCTTAFQAFPQTDHRHFRYAGADSAETCASLRYEANSFLRHWLMGRNYRKEWQQIVTLPVFRLSATSMQIKELGGGMQTKSLKLEDKEGKEWALRTVDKDVSGALPAFLRNTIAHRVVQDQISAAMPYGAAIIGPLAKAIGVIAAQPVIYFVADDTALHPYRRFFANTVCMLEERDPKFESTESTEEVLHKIQSDNCYVINQKLLLKARLLDMLISDWDRHADNWRWGKKDSAGLHYYYAVPRDRDWAFYYSGGLVPKLVRLAALRHLVNFKKHPKYIKSLSAKSQLFDAVFLNSLGASDWQEAVQQLQASLTDSAIEQAVYHLPAAAFPFNGPAFIQKLKSRRDGLEKPVLDYYRFLSRQIQIEGSNSSEVFSLLPAEKGFVLQIHRLLPGGAKGQKIYERRFLEEETYRVVLNGLDGEDRFEMDANVHTGIRLKLNGGTGRDSYDLKGKIRTEVFDEAAEDNRLVNKNGATIRFK